MLSEMSTQMQKYRPAYLNKQIYKPEHQFVLSCGVSPSIDDFEVSKLDKVRVFGVSDGDDGVDLLDQLLLLLVVKVDVPLGQAGFAGPVLDHDEFDTHCWEPKYLKKIVNLLVI